MTASAPEITLRQLHTYAWDTPFLPSAELSLLEKQASGLSDQVAVLRTCQRLEVISLESLPLEAPRTYAGRKALQHVAELAAGLDSLVLGEAEILGQVRTALAAAEPRLLWICAPAIAAARALRREEEFSDHTGHILDHALTLAAVPRNGRLLVLGGGRAGRRVAERAAQIGFDVIVASRRKPVLQPGTDFVPLSQLASIGSVDVIAACLAAGAPCLRPADLPPVSRVIVDLGTPPNIAGESAVAVLDIAAILSHQTTLPAWTEQRDGHRARLALLVDRHLASIEQNPTSPIVIFRNEVESIRRREIKRTMRLHPELDPTTVEVITRSLVNQILHEPTRRLRHLDDSGLAESVARLFARRTGVEGL